MRSACRQPLAFTDAHAPPVRLSSLGGGRASSRLQNEGPRRRQPRAGGLQDRRRFQQRRAAGTFRAFRGWTLATLGEEPFSSRRDATRGTYQYERHRELKCSATTRSSLVAAGSESGSIPTTSRRVPTVAFGFSMTAPTGSSSPRAVPRDQCSRAHVRQRDGDVSERTIILDSLRRSR